MLGKMTDAQIEHLLNNQMTGRIGCYSDKKMYVVPVTYAYHKGYIYAHSKEGLKVQMMRKNPNVCFQIDSIESMVNWRSVILWGKYEELKSEREQKAGMKIMMERLAPYATSETVRAPHAFSHPPQVVEKSFKAVAYRIKILEKTGRFEKPSIAESTIIHK